MFFTTTRSRFRPVLKTHRTGVLTKTTAEDCNLVNLPGNVFDQSISEHSNRRCLLILMRCLGPFFSQMDSAKMACFITPFLGECFSSWWLWWFRPSWKIWSSNWTSSPRIGVKIPKKNLYIYNYIWNHHLFGEHVFFPNRAIFSVWQHP